MLLSKKHSENRQNLLRVRRIWHPRKTVLIGETITLSVDMAFENYFTVNKHPQQLWSRMMLNHQVNDYNAYLSVRGAWTKTFNLMFREVTLELI